MDHFYGRRSGLADLDTNRNRIVRRRNGCDAPLDAFGINEGTGMDMSAIRVRCPSCVHIAHGGEAGSPFALLTSMANIPIMPENINANRGAYA